MHWIRRHRTGRPPHPDVLTPAEWRVLEHVREGLPNAEIAVRLGVSINTVRTHVSSMLAKLDLPDRHALARWQGEPTEASRDHLERTRVALPFPDWGSLARVAAGVAVGASAAAVLWLALGNATDGGPSEDGRDGLPPTPTPSVAATEEPEPSSAALTPTPPPLPEVRIEVPATDYSGVGLVDALPTAAIGPLLAYVHTSVEGAGVPRQKEVRIFDVGAGRAVSSFALSSTLDVSPHLVGREIFVAFGTSIWRFNLDGSGGGPLYASQDHLVYWGGASSDGTMLAVTEERYAATGVRPPRRILVLDAITGDVLLEEEQTYPVWEPFQMLAHAVGWSGSDAVLVLGLHPTHGPEGGTALVHLDGTVDVLAADQHLQPARRQLRMLDGFDPICGHGGATRVEIIEGIPPTTLGTIDAAGPLIEFAEPSPDEDEVLYLVRLGDDEAIASLDALLDDGQCTFPGADDTLDPMSLPYEWRVYDIATGAEGTAPSRLEVHREWYGDRLITFACGGDEVAGIGPDNAYAPTGTAPRGFTNVECANQREDRQLELRVDGVTVDTGYHFQVLGFIEVP